VLFEPVKAKRYIALGYGADHVFDPGQNDLSQQVMAIVPGGFDKAFECSGVKANVGRAITLAADGSQVCIVSVMFSPLTIAEPYLINFKEVRLTASISNTHEENIQCLNWMAEGILDGRPLISDDEPLERLPAVYRERIDTGQAVKVMLQIGEEF
jgi:threonine dehydrogenase-like Zn-dependent dehydrogenase